MLKIHRICSNMSMLLFRLTSSFSFKQFNPKQKTYRMISYIFVVIFFTTYSAFATDSTQGQKQKKRSPLASYWIQNLFFTRGLDVRNDFVTRYGDGAFASRWKFAYSDPISSHYQVQFEVPFALIVPEVGKSVAGLGDVSIQGQAEIMEANFVQQIFGLRLFLPTGSHTQTGGDLTTLVPKYQITLLTHHWLYIVPSFYVEYAHSIIEQDDAKKLRVVRLKSSLSFPHIFPEIIKLSGGTFLEWDFDVVNGSNGGFWAVNLQKAMNPQTALNVEFGLPVSTYTRRTAYEQRYEVDMLTIF